MSDNVIEVINLDTAKDFLEALSPVGPYFGGTPREEVWLYRGQGANHRLIPSALRDDGKGAGGKLARLANYPIKNAGDRLVAERNILAQFFDTADRRGLVLPDDSQELREKIGILMSERGDEFTSTGWDDWMATPQLLSLAALAQHYGIPTRLLDWSRDANVATFFAAQDALNYCKLKSDSGEEQPGDKMVVWAFYFPEFGKQDVGTEPPPIRIVTAPSASNPNLRAQQGAFTMVRRFYSGEDGTQLDSLDEVVKKLARSKVIDEKTRMIKFTLPQSEAPNLLRMLERLNVSPSTVYPGYSGVVQDLEQQLRLRLF